MGSFKYLPWLLLHLAPSRQQVPSLGVSDLHLMLGTVPELPGHVNTNCRLAGWLLGSRSRDLSSDTRPVGWAPLEGERISLASGLELCWPCRCCCCCCCKPEGANLPDSVHQTHGKLMDNATYEKPKQDYFQNFCTPINVSLRRIFSAEVSEALCASSKNLVLSPSPQSFRDAHTVLRML